MTKKERLSMFERELEYIYDENIRDFAKVILENANDYFFTVPASSSGKYHPLMSLGDGGLVRHTRAVAYFVNQFARSEIKFGNLTERDGDLLVLCAIAHDIKKQGENGVGNTVAEHPFLAAEYVADLNDKYDYLTKKEMDKVYNAIHRHMGPWTEPKPETIFDRLLFYADYTASRSDLEIKFISEGITTPVERPVEPVMTVDGYVFHFGKTKGMTIKQAVNEQRSYMDWMVRNQNFGMKDVQALVREYYDREGLDY